MHALLCEPGAADFSAMLALNTAFAVETSALSAEALRHLLAAAGFDGQGRPC